MKVIVSGATGFLGSQLVQQLHEQGNKVVALVRSINGVCEKWDKKVETVICPLSEYTALTEKTILNGNVFFHFAWEGTAGDVRGNVELQLKNVQYTVNAVHLAKQCGCTRFVYAGSIMEYEAIKYLEGQGVEPDRAFIYSTAKLSADFMAKTIAHNIGIEYVNVVISNIYSEYEQSPRFLNSLIRKLKTNEEIALTECRQLYDFIYFSDAMKAIVLAGCQGVGNTSYYIGNSKQYPLMDFVEKAKKLIHSSSNIVYGAIPYRGSNLTYSDIDTQKLEREFGFVPQIDFEEGVKRFL